MTTNDVKNLKELLRRMRAEDPTFRVYGAERHKYLLGPTLTESELQAFEHMRQVRLPEDYRFFLKEAGDGGAIRSEARVIAINAGAGPGCGILPLEETVLGSDFSKPFPLTQATTGQSIDGMDRWGEEEPFPGLLEICYRGGAEFSYLVVNGPDYGMIWNWAGYGEAEREWSPTGLTFDAWYRQWIYRLTDIALPMLARERVVEKVKVGMTKSQIIAICGERWTLREFGDKHRFLRFEHLATQFVLDVNEVVVRIVRHHI